MKKIFNKELLISRILPAIGIIVFLAAWISITRLGFWTYNYQGFDSENIQWVIFRSLSVFLFLIVGFGAFFEISKAFLEKWWLSVILAVFGTISLLGGKNFFQFITHSQSLESSSYPSLQSIFSYNLFQDWLIYLFPFILILIATLGRIWTVKDLSYKNFSMKMVTLYFVFLLINVFIKTFVLLLATPAGLSFLIILFMGAFLSDTFGFLSGILFGNKFIKTKLAPTISPKKTWEGLIGSILFTIFGLILLIITAHYISQNRDNNNNDWYTIIFSNKNQNTYGFKSALILFIILIPAISAFGDLSFSGIKRWCEIKDFSNILAGHGGILDRLDSLMFVFLFFSLISLVPN